MRPRGYRWQPGRRDAIRIPHNATLAEALCDARYQLKLPGDVQNSDTFKAALQAHAPPIVAVLVGRWSRLLGGGREVPALLGELAPRGAGCTGRAPSSAREGPRVVGLTGWIGNPAGYHAVWDCDVLLMVGTMALAMRLNPHLLALLQKSVLAPRPHS